MKYSIFVIALLCALVQIQTAEVRLLDLEPNDAQQIIEQQDQTLTYAPKIESNVPAIRFLGNEPHHVLEDIYLAKQYHGQDGLGGYLYGYNVPDISKTEKKKAGGDLRGAYNYIAGNGQEIKVEYWDDGTGFHQIDNVPKILPKQIDDLPAVKAAKEEHLRLWKEQAERNSRPVANPYNSEGQYASGPLSAQGQQERAQQFAHQPQYPQHVQYQPQGQYQQNQGQYQQPQGQYKLNQGQYQQPQGQYQQPQGQYQQPQYQVSQTQLSNQYQTSPTAPQPVQPLQSLAQGSGYAANTVSDQYSGQYTENKGVYSQQKQVKEEDEEEKGPPKGFFYSFDYPVGIIVSKEGRADLHSPQKREDVHQIYAENKANFEKQLQAGSGNGQSYSFVKN